MKNTIVYIGAAGVLAVIVLIYYFTQTSSPEELPTATSTPITTSSSTPTSPVVEKEVGAPVAVTGSDVTTSEFAASVSGTVTPRGLFTNYWYEYGLTEKLGSKTAMQNIGAGYEVLTAPAYITGLAKNTKYFFSIVAENQYGKVTGNQYIFTTNGGNPAPVGSLPTLKTNGATSIGRTNAQLNGEVTPNKSITQYWFEYGKTTDLGRISSIKSISDTSSKTSVSLSLSELDPATNYYFRINAQNQWGTVNGMTMSFKTGGAPDTAKPGVETRSASNIKTTAATLRGSVNPNGLDTTYWFEYSTDSLLGSVLLKSTERKTTGTGKNEISVESTVSGLSQKTNYFYRIVAQNSLGVSYSERVSFKTR